MRTRLKPLFALFLVALVALAGAAYDARAESAPPFVVIVHPNNTHASLDRKFVGEAFLKKTTRWPAGDVIKPVDLPKESPVRARFSEDVIKRTVAAVKSYWQQIIFAGRDVPPPELSSEEEVVKFVAGNPNAIGYVSGTARIVGTKSVRLE